MEASIFSEHKGVNYFSCVVISFRRFCHYDAKSEKINKNTEFKLKYSTAQKSDFAVYLIFV